MHLPLQDYACWAADFHRKAKLEGHLVNRRADDVQISHMDSVHTMPNNMCRQVLFDLGADCCWERLVHVALDFTSNTIHVKDKYV